MSFTAGEARECTELGTEDVGENVFGPVMTPVTKTHTGQQSLQNRLGSVIFFGPSSFIMNRP